ALREAVYHAYNTRASDQGPHAGSYDNSERIERILALRHEAAQLLGFDSAAHLSLADKMAGTPERVLGFLADLAERARPVAARERDELSAFAAEHCGIARLEPWDIAYSAEKLRQQRFDFSEEELKPYFPLPRVLDGHVTTAWRVFGVALQPRAEVSLWHPDAR